MEKTAQKTCQVVKTIFYAKLTEYKTENSEMSKLIQIINTTGKYEKKEMLHLINKLKVSKKTLIP